MDHFPVQNGGPKDAPREPIAAKPAGAGVKEARPHVAPDQTLNTSLTPHLTSAIKASERKEDVKDKIWGAAVFTAKSFAYASTALVAAVFLGQVAAKPLGINPFAILHDHPWLSHVSTVAHMTVMFLAASAGLGLARFRQAEEQIHQKTEALNDICMIQDGALKLIELRLAPLKECASKHVGETATEAGGLSNAASQLKLCIERLQAEPGSKVGKMAWEKPTPDRLQELSDLRRSFVASLQAVSPTTASIHVPVIDMDAVSDDLRSIGRIHGRWLAQHEDLFEILPKINLPQAHNQVESIRKALDTLKGAPDREVWRTLTLEALQIEASSGDLKLQEKTRALLTYAVGVLQRLPEDADNSTISKSASQMARLFARIGSQIIDADPNTDKYDLVRFQHQNRIRNFAKAYPYSAVSATVVSLGAAVSYWSSCGESLNALLPTVTDLYANAEVGSKEFKNFMPFVIQGSILLVAGAVNYKFRPYLAWASLELSKLTFAAAAPVAWAYGGLHKAVGSAWDHGEKKAVEKVYGKK